MPCDVSLRAAPLMCSESVVAASKKCRSCDTTATARVLHVFELRSSRASHSTAATERWLVGSSRSSTSGFANSAAASATRTRQPPDNARIFLDASASLNPRFRSNADARDGAPSASIARRRSCAAASFLRRFSASRGDTCPEEPFSSSASRASRASISATSAIRSLRSTSA